MPYREHPCRRKNKTILSKYPFKPECSAAAQSTMTGVQGSPTNYVMSLVLPLTGWGSTISIQRPYVQKNRSKWTDIEYENVYMLTVFWQEHLCNLLPNLRHIINRKSIYIATRYRWTTKLPGSGVNQHPACHHVGQTHLEVYTLLPESHRWPQSQHAHDVVHLPQQEPQCWTHNWQDGLT